DGPLRGRSTGTGVCVLGRPSQAQSASDTSQLPRLVPYVGTSGRCSSFGSVETGRPQCLATLGGSGGEPRDAEALLECGRLGCRASGRLEADRPAAGSQRRRTLQSGPGRYGENQPGYRGVRKGGTAQGSFSGSEKPRPLRIKPAMRELTCATSAPQVARASAPLSPMWESGRGVRGIALC